MHEYSSQTYILGLCPTKALYREKSCMSSCISDTNTEWHTWLFLRACYLMLTKLQQTSSPLKVNHKRNECLNFTSKKQEMYIYIIYLIYLILPHNIYLYPKIFIPCLFQKFLTRRGIWLSQKLCGKISRTDKNNHNKYDINTGHIKYAIISLSCSWRLTIAMPPFHFKLSVLRSI